MSTSNNFFSTTSPLLHDHSYLFSFGLSLDIFVSPINSSQVIPFHFGLGRGLFKPSSGLCQYLQKPKFSQKSPNFFSSCLSMGLDGSKHSRDSKRMLSPIPQYSINLLLLWPKQDHLSERIGSKVISYSFKRGNSSISCERSIGTRVKREGNQRSYRREQWASLPGKPRVE